MIQTLIPESLTDSVLPRSAEALGRTDVQIGLRHAARRKDQARYRCELDFALCEILPKFRTSCFAYYENPRKNPRLGQILQREQLEELDAYLLSVLEVLEKTKFKSWDALMRTLRGADFRAPKFIDGLTL